MLQSLSILNFRRFEDLTIKPLSRVNLIAGENSSGKTAVLEALYFLFVDSIKLGSFPSAFRSSQHNPDDFLNFWKWLSFQVDSTKFFCITATDENSLEYQIKRIGKAEDSNLVNSLDEYFFFQINQNKKLIKRGHVSKGNYGIDRIDGGDASWPKFSHFPTYHSTPAEIAEHFNRIAAKKGGERKLVALLNVVEPKLKGLQYLKLGNDAGVYADFDMEDWIPTTQLGQGFNRLLRLFSEILFTQSEIILIDEIENGIHYSATGKVWKGISTIAREENLQVFATTHSYECIKAAHETFAPSETYDLALHRLESDKKGNIHAVTYDRETLGTSLEVNREKR